MPLNFSKDDKTTSSVLWLSINTLTSKILWLVTLVMLMRYLGPSDYGLLASSWAVFGLLAAITDLGMGQSMLRSGSRDILSHRYYFKVVLSVKILITSLILIIILGAAYLYDGEHLETKWFIYIAAGAAILFDHFQTIFMYTAQIIARLKIFTLLRIGQSMFLLILMYVFLSKNGSVFSVSIIHMLTALCFILVNVVVFYNLNEIKELPYNKLRLHAVMSDGIPFLSSILLNLAYYRVDIILLALLTNQKLTGIYSGQYQLILILYTFPSMLVSALLPKMYQISNDKNELRKVFDVCSKYLNVLSILIFPCVFFYAKEIMNLIGGEEFSEEYHGLQILSFLILMFSFTVVLNTLVVVNKISIRLLCELIALIITILLGPLMIKSFGLPGMASIAAFSYLCSGFIGIWYLNKKNHIQLSASLGNFMKLILYALPASIVFYISDANYLINCMAYIILCLLSFMYLKVWDSEDKLRLTRIVKFFNYSK